MRKASSFSSSFGFLNSLLFRVWLPDSCGLVHFLSPVTTSFPASASLFLVVLCIPTFRGAGPCGVRASVLPLSVLCGPLAGGAFLCCDLTPSQPLVAVKMPFHYWTWFRKEDHCPSRQPFCSPSHCAPDVWGWRVGCCGKAGRLGAEAEDRGRRSPGLLQLLFSPPALALQARCWGIGMLDCSCQLGRASPWWLYFMAPNRLASSQRCRNHGMGTTTGAKRLGRAPCGIWYLSSSVTLTFFLWRWQKPAFLSLI